MALICTDSELGTSRALHLFKARVIASVQLKEQGLEICEGPV